MPTLEIEVDASCCYDNVVHLERFEPTFQLAGGINLPKILTCLGSDGKKRRQLVKVFWGMSGENVGCDWEGVLGCCINVLLVGVNASIA